MTINQLCTEIVKSVTAGLGCAVVNLNTGQLIGVSHKVPYFTQSYLDAAAAAAVEMFRGRSVTALEQMITNMRHTEESQFIEEIQMTTKNTLHFMATLPENPDILVILITSKKVNLGMGWSSIRNALPKIGLLCT